MSFNRVRGEATLKQVLYQAGIPAIATWMLIPLTFLLPLIDSTRAPYFDLTRTFSQLAYWLSQSGGKSGAPVVAVLMLIFLVTRAGITFQRRWKEAGIVAVVATLCAWGGAALNEYILKTELKIPRPNIIWLAGENGSGPLGMSPEEFYEIGDKETRGKALAKVLSGVPEPVPLSPAIEAHWIQETGYSLPSGHAFSVMFFASFLLALAATYLTTKRVWLFYLMLPWALAVCYSRPILRVHTPTDIAFGGLQGLAVGLLAWVVTWVLIRKVTYQDLQGADSSCASTDHISH